jgi:monooxygenase
MLDVLIIGAGISGIGAACHLRRALPGKRWLIVEARERLGGTWDLFRYPGIRSDSDLYTFGYDFRPWRGEDSIADASQIRAYLQDTATEYSLHDHIRYGHRVRAASWCSRDACWQVEIARAQAAPCHLRARWLFNATGYYDYEHPHQPAIDGIEDFAGPVVHPQLWPEDLDYAGARIALIGSGATAVTLLPALAKRAAHVTQIQRTPSYVLSIPRRDAVARLLHRVLPDTLAHSLSRRKNILRQRGVLWFCKRYPHTARRIIGWANRRMLPAHVDVDTHFSPPYPPWDQRLCAALDGDFFDALAGEHADIVTGRIERITTAGVKMSDGKKIPADIVVMATGLNLKLFGGAELLIDGTPVNPAEHFVFKGLMLDGVPNFCFAIGYTSSSWTLKIGLLCEYFCRLLTEMDRREMAVCTPRRPHDLKARPLLDFGAGYVKRSLDALPRQGDRPPWEMTFDYLSDARQLRRGPVLHPALELKAANQPSPE